MFMIRRPEIPKHVLERQPKGISGNEELVTPSLIARGLKRIMPQLIDLAVARGTAYFITETSPAGYHSLRYKVRESGKIVADRFQPPTGQGSVWTAGYSDLVNGPRIVEGEYAKAESQPLLMRYLKEQGIFPVLEDPSFIPGEKTLDNTETSAIAHN